MAFFEKDQKSRVVVLISEEDEKEWSTVLHFFFFSRGAQKEQLIEWIQSISVVWMKSGKVGDGGACDGPGLERLACGARDLHRHIVSHLRPHP